MIAVFKTNVSEENHAAILLSALSETFPSAKTNFDLEDCDNILKVEGENIHPGTIIDILNTRGYSCEILT